MKQPKWMGKTHDLIMDLNAFSDFVSARKYLDKFIEKALKTQRDEMVEKVKGMKKNTNVYKQSLVALKMRDKYSLPDIRNIIKGYNKALDQVIQLLEEAGSKPE